MRILSLFYGHDANCTLMEDGVPIVVLEKERLTRVKHDKGAMDIGAILEAYGWNPEAIDVVAVSPDQCIGLVCPLDRIPARQRLSQLGPGIEDCLERGSVFFPPVPGVFSSRESPRGTA